MKNLWLALSLLTVFPVPAAVDRDTDLSAAASWFPVVGAIVGACLSLLFMAAAPLTGSEAAAVIVLTGSLLLTRGLHLDGLADTADALAGSLERERALAIMKDPAAGPMGVAAILLVLLFKYACLTAPYAAGEAASAVVLMPVCGRWGIVLAGACSRPARPEGLGNLFIAALGWKMLLAASLWGVALTGFVGRFFPAYNLALPAGMAGGMAVAGLTALFLNRRIGGLTGDTLGMINELGEAAFLACFLAVLTVSL